MANVEVRGTVSFGPQQQFFARNCSAKSWDGGAWSCVFVGCSGAPHREQAEAASKGPVYTSVATSQVIAEKPFIIRETDGRYKLVVPSAMTGRSGTNFEVVEEEMRDFSAVYVAQPSNGAAEINKKLAEGKDVVFAPGIYKLDETIHVQRSCQVLLALGFATLVAPTDSPCIVVKDDAVGVRISGMMLEAPYRPLEATSTESISTGPKALLQWGCGRDARSWAELMDPEGCVGSFRVIAHVWGPSASCCGTGAAAARSDGACILGISARLLRSCRWPGGTIHCS